MKKILIIGLPGAGKTTLASSLCKLITSCNLSCSWYNADKVREKYNDWDFSSEGRRRQARRMCMLADTSSTDYVIIDFVCPLESLRKEFNADCVVWVDTIKESRYTDTNKIFEIPTTYDVRVTEKNSEKWAEHIISCMLKK